MTHRQLIRLATVCLAHLVLLLMASTYTAQAVTPIAKYGVLDLSAWSFETEGPVVLAGDWRLYPGYIVTAEDVQSQSRSLRSIGIGQVWPGPRISLFMPESRDIFQKLADQEAQQAEDEGRSEGVSTYHLSIVAMDAQELAVRLPASGMAMRLLLNDQVIVQNGQMSRDVSQVQGDVFPAYARFSLPAGRSELLWHVVESEQAQGVPLVAPVFSTVADAEAGRQWAVGVEMTVLGLLMVFAVLLAAGVATGYMPLSAAWLAGASGLTAVYIGLTGEVFLGQILGLDWETVLRLKYASVFFALPAFLLSVRLADQQALEPMSLGAAVVGALMAFATAVQPPMVFGGLTVVFAAAMTIAVMVSIVMNVYKTHPMTIGAVAVGGVGFLLSALSLVGLAPFEFEFAQLGAVLALTILTTKHLLDVMQSVFGTFNINTHQALEEDEPAMSGALSVSARANSRSDMGVGAATQQAGAGSDEQVLISRQASQSSEYKPSFPSWQDVLSALGEGVLIVDQHHVIVYCNQRYRLMRDLPLSLSREGLPYADLMTYLARRGDLGPGQPDLLVEDELLKLDATRPTQEMFTTAEDTVLEQWRHPMDNGGLVFTCRDITDLLAWKQELEQSGGANGRRALDMGQQPKSLTAMQDQHVLPFKHTDRLKDQTELDDQDGASQGHALDEGAVKNQNQEAQDHPDTAPKGTELLKNEESGDVEDRGAESAEDQGGPELEHATDVFAQGGPELPDLPADLLHDEQEDPSPHDPGASRAEKEIKEIEEPIESENRDERSEDREPEAEAEADAAAVDTHLTSMAANEAEKPVDDRPVAEVETSYIPQPLVAPDSSLPLGQSEALEVLDLRPTDANEPEEPDASEDSEFIDPDFADLDYQDHDEVDVQIPEPIVPDPALQLDVDDDLAVAPSFDEDEGEITSHDALGQKMHEQNKAAEPKKPIVLHPVKKAEAQKSVVVQQVKKSTADTAATEVTQLPTSKVMVGPVSKASTQPKTNVVSVPAAKETGPKVTVTPVVKAPSAPKAAGPKITVSPTSKTPPASKASAPKASLAPTPTGASEEPVPKPTKKVEPATPPKTRHEKEDKKEDAKPVGKAASSSAFDRAKDSGKPADINMETLKEVYGLDMEGARSLIAEKLQRCEQQLTELEASILKGDGELARKIARAIRGSSRVLGLDNLVYTVAGIEGALASNAWVDAIQAVHTAQDARKEALKAMSSLPIE